MINAFYKKTLLFLVVIALLCGCASTSIRDVAISLPDEIVFSGRGASAGVALMGVLGPSGIAIGTAIDVGIAKEIKSVNNFTLLQKQLQETLTNHNKANLADNPVMSIQITRIEFNSVPVDLVALQLEGYIQRFSGELIPLKPTDTVVSFKTLQHEKGLANSLVLESVENIINELKRN